MPRKDFLRDLERASPPQSLFLGISDIRLGDDDESICFSYSSPLHDEGLSLDFQVAISDLSEYPLSHEYLIFSLSATVPLVVVDVLDGVRLAVAGAPVHDLFTIVSDALSSVLTTPSVSTTWSGHNALREGEDRDSDGQSVLDPGSDNGDVWEDDLFDEDQQFFGSVQMELEQSTTLTPDLRATKAAGFKAFVRASDDSSPLASPLCTSDEGLTLLPLFIQTPLNTLLNEHFFKIVEIRHNMALSCSPAVESDIYTVGDGWGPSVPEIVQADQLTAVTSLDELSLPLVTMQFLLRHFVKCTEFCLVCHCRMDMSFEALKPYVCTKSLCLYQYMALGIGHSVEWEILQQPYVVDLLVSFTYASAAANALEDFPGGLGIMVPSRKESLFKGNLHTDVMQLTVCTDKHDGPFIKPGDWILILASGKEPGRDWHCRVQDTDQWPVIDLLAPIKVQYSQSSPQRKSRSEDNLVFFSLYDKNFDGLTENSAKCEAIKQVLDTLPDVVAMRSFLESVPYGSTMQLSSWNRVTPAAFDMLRWIVASNRSCIMQESEVLDSHPTRPYKYLIEGMDGYLQFRFAQGSPDKEERFCRAIKTHASNSTCPTLYAWHGSPLCNWHGIIREGLMYKKVVHGRALGDGVYLARHFSTSLGYATRGNLGSQWPNSHLHIDTALSLNEVVNKPTAFRYHNGGIYVVRDIEWIQTRYLFVRCEHPLTKKGSATSSRSAAAFSKSLPYYPQDEAYIAHGATGRPINIPIAVHSQRSRQALTPQEPELAPANACSEASIGTKARGMKRKAKRTSASKLVDSRVCDVDDGRYMDHDDEDDASVTTMIEDLAVLFSDAEDNELEVGKEKKTTPIMMPVTDFEPGQLSESSLTLLNPPSYATTTATSFLQQRLIQTLRVQERHATRELGWYINPQLITTPYQWIVELHSFDLSLPLGQDLQWAGIQSIVLEMRFPKDFPMSPPFVRIVRPRLLESNQGGGGHVTQGGALCMELLTSSGWLPSYSIESVLVSLRMALSSTEPRPARLLQGQTRDRLLEYSMQDAVSAYVRACRTHGWEVPKEFHSMAW